MGYQVDATDLKIIAIMLANGRTPSLEIARQVGVVEGTVRKRLERLLNEGVIKVAAAVDYEALGYGTRVLVHVQAELGHVANIGRELASHPNIVSVSRSTGGSELVAEAVFRTDRELVGFLQDHLEPAPGVGRVETTHLVGSLKRASQWRLPEATAIRQQPSRRASILVVDDDPTFFETTRAVLESAGYRVTGAIDGKQGLAAMRQNRPDLVILDIMMSYLLDGLDVSREMGEDVSLRGIPILMVSALPTSEHTGAFPTDEYLRASDFLAKPVAPATLLARVDRVLADTMVSQPS